MLANNQIKQIFTNNYSSFLKNVLNYLLKIKLNYEVKNCKPFGDSLFIEVSSNVKDIFNYSNKKILESYIFTNSKCTNMISSSEESSNILFRTNHHLLENLEMKFVKNSKNEKETNIEIWHDAVLITSIKIEDFNITKVYFDDVFGKPKFSDDGKKIIFIAEFDTGKTFKNYFNIKETDQTSSENQLTNIEKNLSKYEYQNDFGESLKDKSNPKIFVFDIERNKILYLNLDEYKDIYPATPLFDFTNNDIVFTGYNFPDLKYGLIYCLKRRSSIYLIRKPFFADVSDLKQEEGCKNILIEISTLSGDQTNIFPIFSKNYNHLVWMSNEKSTPHMNGLRLNSINWEAKKSLDNLDSEIQKYNSLANNFKKLIEKVEYDNNFFNGIYSYEDTICHNCFITNDIYIFSTQHKNTSAIFLFDLVKNRLVKIPSELSSDKFLSVKVIKEENKVLIYIFSLSSDVDTHPQVNLTKFNYDEYLEEKNFKDIDLENGCKYLESFETEKLFSRTTLFKNQKIYKTIEKLSFTCGGISSYLQQLTDYTQVDDLCINGVKGHFIYNPNCYLREKSPIVYFLHGGPNSAVEKMFILSINLFLVHGYSVLVVNYPGSTGYGQKYLNSLNGKIGKTDVESCGEFLTNFISGKDYISKYESFIDFENVMLYGGSHGGFLTCWLSCHEKYANLFSSAAIRNPVTDLPSMMATTDIPDWVIGQTTDLDLDSNFPPSNDLLKKMKESSPIYLAHNCVTPSLICLGKLDKRVNFFNGMYYHEALKKNKCETKLLLYPEDSHPLSSIETEIDCLFNICYWFEKYIKK
jgi:hypothetical protein